MTNFSWPHSLLILYKWGFRFVRVLNRRSHINNAVWISRSACTDTEGCFGDVEEKKVPVRNAQRRWRRSLVLKVSRCLSSDHTALYIIGLALMLHTVEITLCSCQSRLFSLERSDALSHTNVVYITVLMVPMFPCRYTSRTTWANRWPVWRDWWSSWTPSQALRFNVGTEPAEVVT